MSEVNFFEAKSSVTLFISFESYRKRREGSHESARTCFGTPPHPLITRQLRDRQAANQSRSRILLWPRLLHLYNLRNTRLLIEDNKNRSAFIEWFRDQSAHLVQSETSQRARTRKQFFFHVLTLGPVPRNLENAALFLSTLICHENGAFRAQ